MESGIPGSLGAAARRELTVYDTPVRRTPEDEARERARQVESHPFLYYLAQFVPGLRQEIPAEAAGDSATVAIESAASRAAAGAGLWGQDAGVRLVADTSPGPRETRAPAPDGSIPVVLAPPAFQVAPTPPAAELEPTQAAQPVEIPRIVLGQVERLNDCGHASATLRFQLDPPSLGKVDLAVTYAQQKVSVNVVAATQQAKEQLDQQLSQIRSILHAHQFRTADVKVLLASEAGSAGSQGQDMGQEPGGQPQRYRRRRRSNPVEDAIAGI